ncbi:MAG: glucokinase [Luteimonas sp.]
MTDALVLLADIGGTNARFALADLRLRAPLKVESVCQYEVAHFPSLADAARHYLDSPQGPGGDVRSGVFAIAGRVDGDKARITNHPWVISRTATRDALELQRLRLVNDFSAQAMAIELLTPADLVAIGNVGWTPPLGAARTYAVLGPGTGLGVSALIVRDGQHIALETEGGHVSFPAGNREEASILEHLLAHFPRVSNERLVSGSGLVNIHRALSEIAGETCLPMHPRDVTAGAASGDARCRHAIEVFCAVFGAIAGDLALTLGAWDGVFLTGGLVPKLLRELQSSQFRARFEAKGRFSDALRRVPTMAVMHPHAGLLGAAAIALQEAASPRSASAPLP